MPQNPVYQESSIPAEIPHLMRLATYASLSVAVVLIIAKTLAWVLTDSVSMLATLIDSTLDAIASLVNLLAVRHAVTPADREHRFGHGKAEALAGLAQSAFVAGSAGFLLLESGRRLLHPAPLESWGPGIVVMVFSIAATLALLVFQQYVIRRTDSTAIKADALHYRSDFLVNGSVIAALWLAGEGWGGFDALIAIGIAAIVQIATSHPEVRGLHDLRSRRSGMATFLQLHLEVDDDLTLVQAHEVSDEVEWKLQEAYPTAEIIIHIDPVSVVPHEPLPAYLQQ